MTRYNVQVDGYDTQIEADFFALSENGVVFYVEHDEKGIVTTEKIAAVSNFQWIKKED